MNYCVDCPNFEKRPLMAEVPFLSGNYKQTGTYHRCKITGKIYNTWSMKDVEIEYLTCDCKKQ